MRFRVLLAVFVIFAASPALAKVALPLPKPAHFSAAKKKEAVPPPAPAKDEAAAVKDAAGPEVREPAAPAVKDAAPQRKEAALQGGGEDEKTPPPAVDVDEALPLPDYPPFARIAIGKEETYVADEEDTLLDVARHYGLGYVEVRAANPDIDPWAPGPGAEIVIPAFRLLPRARQEGVVVNLAEMRMYYFRKPGAPPETWPIGIGKDGLMTPVGETTVVRKVAGPSWHPTERMRKEKPFLPASLGPGAQNPLGSHALYLGWPTFLIHGSNKPWAIGRRVSSGCMRMYPEDIRRVYDLVPVGTKVTVVEQPILVGWVDDALYIEANPSRIQSNELEIEGQFVEKPLTPGLRKVIENAAGKAAEGLIDWDIVEKAVRERRGYPVRIAQLQGGKKSGRPKAETKSGRQYN